MRTLFAFISLIALLQQATIEVDVQLEQRTLVVRDASGKLVRHLTARDFILEENGIPQTIAHFSEDPDVPVSMGILIDISGSMAARSGGLSRLGTAQGTARLLLRLMKPRDEFSLMTFSDGFDVQQGFTENPQVVESRVNKLSLAGGTNLFGAIEKALQKMKTAKYRKKALVIITDGLAGGSLQELAGKVSSSEVIIYTFGLDSSNNYLMGGLGMKPVAPRVFPGIGAVFPTVPNSSTPKQILDMLANESGGASGFFDIADLDQALQEMVLFVQNIVADLRGQYTIGYYSKVAGFSTRSVRLRAVSADYRVTSRRSALEPEARKP
jgi:VWFA-related protein